MSLYFMVHDAKQFHDRIHPALAKSWRSKSFAPIVPLVAHLTSTLQQFVESGRLKRDDVFLFQVQTGTLFDRGLWRLAVGEMLLGAAVALPEIPNAEEPLGILLKQDSRLKSAYHGTRGLHFGSGWYRPDECGWNSQSDVARLAPFLSGVDTAAWSMDALRLHRQDEPEAEILEELDFARSAIAPLRELYQQAYVNNCVVICETI